MATGEMRRPEGTLEATELAERIEHELALARTISEPVWLTWALVFANVAFFVGAYCYGLLYMSEHLGVSVRGLTPLRLANWTGMKIPRLVEAGQWWRLISSMFVHLDVAHIVFNGYGLYAIGPIIERFYGRARMFTIYMASGALATLASQLFSEVPSGGASGALYGLVGAMLALGFKYRAVLPPRFSKALTTGMLPWVVFGIGIGFFDFVPFDNSAHIGGLIAGAALALVMRARLAPGEGPRWGEASVRVAAGLSAIALALSILMWGVEVEQCTGSLDAMDMCYPELFE